MPTDEDMRVAEALFDDIGNAIFAGGRRPTVHAVLAALLASLETVIVTAPDPDEMRQVVLERLLEKTQGAGKPKH